MIRPIVIVSLLGATLLFILACIIPILGIYLSSALEAQSKSLFPIFALELFVTILMCLITIKLSKNYPNLWPLWLLSSSFVVGILGWVGSIGHIITGGNKLAIFFWAGLIGSLIPATNGVAMVVGRGRGRRRGRSNVTPRLQG